MAKTKQQTKIAVLQVRAMRASFRRAGFQFGTEPVNIPLADLKKEQLAAIKSEPMLVAIETEIDGEAEGEEAAA